jgi:hypothetical protein
LTPELRREADKIRDANAEKKQALADRIREAADSDRPIWEDSKK